MDNKVRVAHAQCADCLFTSRCLVSPTRKADILRLCLARQSYFVCHEASLKGQRVVCRGFYDRLGHTSQLLRIMQRLNGIAFADVATLENGTDYDEEDEA